MLQPATRWRLTSHGFFLITAFMWETSGSFVASCLLENDSFTDLQCLDVLLNNPETESCRSQLSVVYLFLLPCIFQPSISITSGSHESPEKVTEAIRGKCFEAPLLLWAYLMIRFILCLTCRVCDGPNWSGNISDFAPLHLEKNCAPKQLEAKTLQLLDLALKGATGWLRMGMRRVGVKHLRWQKKKCPECSRCPDAAMRKTVFLFKQVELMYFILFRQILKFI